MDTGRADVEQDRGLSTLFQARDVDLAAEFRTPKAGQLLARYIRQKIVSGELSEGSRLPVEPELMQMFGVSRTILREALRILESESLLRVSRGSRRGAVVMHPDLRLSADYAGIVLQLNRVTIADVYAARQAMEPVIARMLATNPSAETLATLEQALVAEREALKQGPEAYARAGAAFHDLLIDLCGNRTLAVLAGTLNEIIKRQMVAARLPDNPDQMLNSERANRTHAKLVELIRAGAVEEAEQLWRSHHEGAAKVIVRDHGARTVSELLQS